MILAVYSCGKVSETRTFSGMEEAAGYTRIGAGRIRWCIDTGSRWRGWTFDEIDQGD